MYGDEEEAAGWQSKGGRRPEERSSSAAEGRTEVRLARAAVHRRKVSMEVVSSARSF